MKNKLKDGWVNVLKGLGGSKDNSSTNTTFAPPSLLVCIKRGKHG